jgi:RNA polymerase sigma-70 factor (ECF subfamily)
MGELAALTYEPDLASPDVADQVVEREAAKRVLSALPARDVEVLVLATWYGLEPRVLGCSATTFTVRLHRARKRLAKALQPGRTQPAGHREAMLGEAAR